MNFVVIGVNHKKAPLEVREKFSFNNDSIIEYYQALKKYNDIQESFILSTCNRVEIYGIGLAASVITARLKDFLCQAHKLSQGFLEKYLYVKTGQEAKLHLLRVSSGLDSMIIGEAQIMGQLRKAYAKASSLGAIGTYLHKEIQEALHIGKKVRSLTNISRGVTSIPGVVVELIKKETGLKNKRVLVIGAGKIGTMTVSKLAGLGLKKITVINRDRALAEELKKKQNVCVADISMLQEELSCADIIIAATAAPHIISRSILETIIHAREEQLLLIDLGVPRNIDETVQNTPKARLYNIDGLTPFIEETMRNRSIEALKAEEIIRNEVELPVKNTNDTIGILCAR